MCGIGGFVTANGHSKEEACGTCRKMVQPLSHRGPDANGIWADNNAVLGHRRLSVLELSAHGAQPMHSENGRFVVSYNGEIYNHLELRTRLEQEGSTSSWRGHSDTETILAAISHWGIEGALKNLIGMFALAIWDRKQRTISLARDRFGEKPLYWCVHDGKLAFGSELKTFNALPWFSPEVDKGVVPTFLRYGYIPEPRSIYRNVYKLEPGTILTAEVERIGTSSCRDRQPGEPGSDISIRRFWSYSDLLERGRASVFRDERSALDALETALRDSISRQKLSDVPLGAFLSGGVDSSLIVALMQSGSASKVDSFTIQFDNAAYDESEHAARVANHLGTHHHTTLVTEADARDVIPLLPSIYDEPFGDSSQIPTYLVSKAARGRVTVALSGDGGDELFGGYNRYFWGPRIWRRSAFLGPVGRRIASHIISAIPDSIWNVAGQSYSAMRPAVGGIALPAVKVRRLATSIRNTENFDEFYRNLASYWSDPAKLVRGVDSEETQQDSDGLSDQSMTPAERMMIADLKTYLPGDILCKVDRAAMSNSLETRAPFLDPDVALVAARLPIDMKIRENEGKWALRQILYKHVPREMIERPKVGFSVPMGEWLRGPLRDWGNDLLGPVLNGNDELLEPAPILHAWQQHCSGTRDWSAKLWPVLMLQAWRNHKNRIA